jgi:hypothetical protein
VISCVFAAALAVLGVATVANAGADLARATDVARYAGAAVPMLALVWVALRRAAGAQSQGRVLRSFQWTFAAYATAFCITALALFPTIDRWQELPLLARRIRSDTRHESLALLNPDETTVAMLDRRLRTQFTALTTDGGSRRRAVADWFAAHGNRARVLVLLPGHASGELTPLLEWAHLYHPPGDGVAGKLAAEGVAAIVRRYRLPHGRRYALLAPPEVPLHSTSSQNGP